MTLRFQFQTGAIKSEWLDSLAMKWNYRFNSKLVRLKACLAIANLRDAAQFQFQTGAIKSPTPTRAYPIFEVFQFQTGAIKRVTISNVFRWNCLCFNSKLVRLKASFSASPVVPLRFQFQTGAIKRSHSRTIRYPRSCMFQFQTGAIKRVRVLCETGRRWNVSIPNWCD